MRRRYRPFTLIEIMLVIFLIGLIGSVVGVNMKGSLDKGKVFRTEQAQKQLENVLSLQLAEGLATKEGIESEPERFLLASGLVKDVQKVLQDGWGNEFAITVQEDGEVTAYSQALEDYKNRNKKGKKTGSKKRVPTADRDDM